ncbi:hypothetical protein M569_10295, partial [Genlisea aurea]
MKLSYCSTERKPCVRFVERVFGDCLCNVRDEISFGFGLFGLVLWAVAEIPQIVTNFFNKSADGVSLAFLSTWIIGDVFNIVGCILEPATLPTQYYTAWLYTIVSSVLALQCVYYNHFVKWWRFSSTVGKNNVDETEPLRPKFDLGVAHSKRALMDVPHRREFYFMSARSLVGSNTPPKQYYVRPRSGPPTLEHLADSSEEEDDGISPRPVAGNSFSRPLPIPRPVKYGTLAAAAANLPRLGQAVSGETLEKRSVTGQWLGWLMAVTYMGGRIPQIWLNMKRGSVEGLNPLMFLLALMANVTYVLSILVRNCKWEVIQNNLPWLLDAVVCVLLDLFIIIQCIFYNYVKGKRRDEEEDVA